MKKHLIQRRLLTSAVLFITMLAPVAFGQGALTPPGAPAPTMKTLAQVEPRTPIPALPYTITNAGSYYLTANLTGAGGVGITVMADHVTIDLCGFAIIGVGQFGGTVHAIFVPGPQVDLKVLNGSITLWSGEGVSAPLARNSKLEDLRVSTIGRSALDIGDGSEVRDCLVQSNCSYAVGVPAILAGNHCAVRSCVAQANSGPGIKVGKGAIVQNCVANTNTDGIVAGDDSRVSDCDASLNTGNNPGDGIFVGYGSTVSGCVASGNAHDGIETISGGSVLACTVWTNMNDGIVVQYGSTVKDCTASANLRDGIGVTLHCQAVGNTCDANHNDGIHAYIGGNRIDSNSVTTNSAAGIDCLTSSSTGDLVIRNNASGNGANYSINVAPSGTQNAMIYVMPGPNFVVPDPWANFSH